MRKLILLSILFFGAFTASAQNFNAEAKTLSASLGFVSGYGMPITLQYEHAVSDNIGIGGLVGYAGDSDIYANYTNLLFGVRGNYHYTEVDKLDLYAGLTLGYNYQSLSSKNSATVLVADSGLLLGAHLGARYYFSEKFAAFSELGFGLAVLSVGVSIKF